MQCCNPKTAQSMVHKGCLLPLVFAMKVSSSPPSTLGMAFKPGCYSSLPSYLWEAKISSPHIGEEMRVAFRNVITLTTKQYPNRVPGPVSKARPKTREKAKKTNTKGLSPVRRVVFAFTNVDVASRYWRVRVRVAEGAEGAEGCQSINQSKTSSSAQQ